MLQSKRRKERNGVPPPLPPPESILLAHSLSLCLFTPNVLLRRSKGSLDACVGHVLVGNSISRSLPHAKRTLFYFH